MTPSDTPDEPVTGALVIKKRPMAKTPAQEAPTSPMVPPLEAGDGDFAPMPTDSAPTVVEGAEILPIEDRVEDDAITTPPLFVANPDLLEEPMPIDAVPEGHEGQGDLGEQIDNTPSAPHDGGSAPITTHLAQDDDIKQDDAQERFAQRFAEKREQRLQEGVEDVVAVKPEDVFNSPDDGYVDTSPAPAVIPAAAPSLSKGMALGEASQHLRAVQGDLDGFAQQITLGEFGANGAGDAGRVWRAIDAAPTDEAVDIWGEMMAISTGLWSKTHILPSIAFLEKASQDFTVPDVWKDRVHQSLQTAKDYKAALSAEEAYEAGRDAEAMEHANTISNQEEANAYRQDLDARSKRRALKTRIGLITAGVLVVGLIVMSIIAIMTRERITIVPPTPDFSAVGDALETVSEDLRDQREVRDQVPATTLNPLDAPTEPTTGVPALDSALTTPPVASETNTLTLPTTTPTTTDSVLPDLQTPADATLPTQQAPQPPAPVLETPITPAPVTPNPGASTPVDTGTFAPVQVPPAQTTPPQTTPSQPAQQPQAAAPIADAGMINSCILGYAVMAEAETLAQGQGPDVQQRLLAFDATIQSACTSLNIPPSTIIRGMGTLDPTDVSEMAQSILATPR